MIYKYYQHIRTGAKASRFSAGIDDEWLLITSGYTIEDRVSGTEGMGRKPFKTIEEAQNLVDKWN